MKNLISMVDFVLEEHKKTNWNSYNVIVNYANFLKQPLELWMFVPCDEDGNVMEEPINNSRELDSTFLDKNLQRKFDFAFLAYQQAKERCLFENHDLDVETIKHHINIGRALEYFAYFETLQLTPTALKQIGL